MLLPYKLDNSDFKNNKNVSGAAAEGLVFTALVFIVKYFIATVRYRFTGTGRRVLSITRMLRRNYSLKFYLKSRAISKSRLQVSVRGTHSS